MDHSLPRGSWGTYSVLFTGILAVSTAAIFIRLAQNESLASLLIAASRLGIAALVLSPIVLSRYRSDLRHLMRRDLALLAFSGLVLALHFILWVTSLEFTTVLVSVVLVTTSPLWSALLEYFFLRSRLSRSVIFGLLLVLAGSIVISVPAGNLGFGSEPLTGSLMAAGGAIAFSIYMVIGRSMRPKIPLLPYIWIVYGIAAIVAFAAVLLSHVPVVGYPNEAYLWLLALGIIPQLIGHSSLNYALKLLSATYIGIATQLEPVLSAALAFLVFGEIPGVWQFTGSLIILSGVTLATWGQSRALNSHSG